jgi:hypothetical protein
MSFPCPSGRGQGEGASGARLCIETLTCPDPALSPGEREKKKMSCEHEQLVHAYHDSQLAPSRRADVEAHLGGCASCSELLRDLQSISHLISTASLPHVSTASAKRYYQAWNLANHRSILRISTWLTGTAAAVLVGSLFLWPERKAENVAVSSRPSNWELVAMMPPQERTTDRPDELIELAQWMADDLSTASR